MKVKVSDYIADFLAERGVEHVFTITGGGAMHLNDSFGHHEKLKCIYNHHEQACTMAAESYARLTGRLAAVVVTTGPGGINAMNGVFGAWTDSLPMIVISGQVKTSTCVYSTGLPLRQFGDQEYDIVSSVKNMTKYAVMVKKPNQIRHALECAYFMASNGRKGPVWVDVPLDVQSAYVYTEELTPFDSTNSGRKENPVYDGTYVDKISEAIYRSKRPVVLAGTGIRSGEAYKEFIDCTDAFKLPVLTAWNAKDLLWENNPYYVGVPGTVGTRGANFILQNADLILIMGCRLNIRMTGYNDFNLGKDAVKIMVDIDENEMKRPNIKIDIPIHANVKDVMRDLSHCDTEELGEHTEWLKWCKEINKRYPAVLPEYSGKKKPLNPYVFINALSHKLGDGDVTVASNGGVCVISNQAFDISKGGRLYTNSGSASMGYGLPAALGAVTARNNKRVVCLEGDGSIMMNLQELETVSYYKMNIKLFIMNNNGYHSIRQTQQNIFKTPLVGVSPENGVGFPDFSKVAAAFDIPYIKIDSLTKLDEKLDKALSGDGPVCVEVVVDEKQGFEPKLNSRVGEDGSMISPELDDMYPFLPREEYEAVRKEARAIEN